MLVQAAFAAWRQVFSAPFRGILWKSLALTVALLALIWFAVTRFLAYWLQGHPLSSSYPFVDSLAFFLAGAGLVVALAFVMPAVSAIVAGFFLDDAAEIVERTDFPGEPPGEAMTIGASLLMGVRFAALSLVCNLAALALILVPVVNVAAFFGVNAYLLGREYFELAAARFRPAPEAAAMRRHHARTAWAAGAMMAGLLSCRSRTCSRRSSASRSWFMSTSASLPGTSPAGCAAGRAPSCPQRRPAPGPPRSRESRSAADRRVDRWNETGEGGPVPVSFPCPMSPSLFLRADRRQSPVAADVQRGVRRLFSQLGYVSLPEFTLASGRRADVIALGGDGLLTIVEIKSSVADFRADRKWPDYRDFCDRFFFAVPDTLPRAILPEDTGLIVADSFGAAILREAPPHPLAGARRKAVTLRFAHAAAGLLHALADPDAVADGRL
jgi:CysZ protein